MRVAASQETGIAGILRAADRRVERISVIPLPGGANNRVFLVDTDAERLVAKYYFRHPDDSRDRLRAEYGLLTYAAACGLTNVPRPVACDPDLGIAIYSYIEGRAIVPSDLGQELVGEAADFFRALNERRYAPEAAALPEASEACFSLTHHLELIDARIARLGAIEGGSPADAAARGFVARLAAAWENVRRDILGRAAAAGIVPDAGLSQSQRCISPSDFGFHNALRAPGGTTCFLDFEYAGWDDPAKMGADFFCQPAVPVPSDYMQDFLAQALASLPEPERLADRARLLVPAYRIKWCCIVLNEFLPGSARRHAFASGTEEAEARKVGQLEKAERILGLA